MNIKLLILLLVLFVSKSYAQQTTILKSTITSVGSTTVHPISINNKSYEIQQSIGQSSILGTKSKGNTSVQQGFLNNNIIFSVNNSDIDDIDEFLDLVISPNPFVDHIKINFSRETKHMIYIIIYDTNGKVLYSQKNNPTDNVIVPMRHYAVGNYIIQIQSGQNKFAKKLLKTE